MAHYGRGAPADRLEKNASKIRRLTGEMWPPAAGEDIMSAIYNVPVEGKLPQNHHLVSPAPRTSGNRVIRRSRDPPF